MTGKIDRYETELTRQAVKVASINSGGGRLIFILIQLTLHFWERVFKTVRGQKLFGSIAPQYKCKHTLAKRMGHAGNMYAVTVIMALLSNPPPPPPHTPHTPSKE